MHSGQAYFKSGKKQPIKKKKHWVTKYSSAVHLQLTSFQQLHSLIFSLLAISRDLASLTLHDLHWLVQPPYPEPQLNSSRSTHAVVYLFAFRWTPPKKKQNNKKDSNLQIKIINVWHIICSCFNHTCCAGAYTLDCTCCIEKDFVTFKLTGE